MDSSQSSGNSVANFIVGLVVIVAIVAFFVWLSKRASKHNKESAWTGVVTKKGVGTNYDEDGEGTKYYNVYVQLDGSGKKKTIRSGTLYNAVEVGDKLVKVAGEDLPKKA